jgi:hypothetical protein
MVDAQLCLISGGRHDYYSCNKFNSERTPSDNQFILFVMVIAKIFSNVKMVDAPGNWLKLNSC